MSVLPLKPSAARVPRAAATVATPRSAQHGYEVSGTRRRARWRPRAILRRRSRPPATVLPGDRSRCRSAVRGWRRETLNLAPTPHGARRSLRGSRALRFVESDRIIRGPVDSDHAVDPARARFRKRTSFRAPALLGAIQNGGSSRCAHRPAVSASSAVVIVVGLRLVSVVRRIGGRSTGRHRQGEPFDLQHDLGLAGLVGDAGRPRRLSVHAHAAPYPRCTLRRTALRSQKRPPSTRNCCAVHAAPSSAARKSTI